MGQDITNSQGQIIIAGEAIGGIEEEEEDVTTEVEGGSAIQELAMGYKIPTSVKTPISYLDNMRNYSDLFNDQYKQMEVAWKLYRFNPIIGNAVDVLVDFSVTDVKVEDTGNKELDIIIKWFLKFLNRENSNTEAGIYPLMQEICLEWFTSGNAFPYAKWDNVLDIEGTSGVWKMPTSINLLNPQGIEIPNGPIAFGQEVIYLKQNNELLEKLAKDGRSDPEAALIKKAIPRSILNALRSRKGSFQGNIRLNPKFVSHLKRKAKGYQAWGIPYLSRAFSSAALLERIRQLDENVATGLLNLITIFKIGTDEHPASRARLLKFSTLIRNPKATTTLVWAHDIEVLQVGPEGKILAYKDKYKDTKEDLFVALGIPPVLMAMNQQGDEWVSILSLIEKLMSWRKTMTLWLDKICNQIAVNNGFEEKVSTSWDRMSLKDEASVKNLILSFYDRGLISIDTALDRAGYNIDSELRKKTTEEAISDKFAPPNLPFSGDENNEGEVDKGRPNDSDPTMKEKVKEKSKDKPIKTVNLKEEKKRAKPTTPKQKSK